MIDQERVAIQEGDTPDTLAERVLEREHILYPRALAKAIDDFLDREAEDAAEA